MCHIGQAFGKKNKNKEKREKKEDHHDQQGKERKGTLCIVFSQEKKSKDYKQTHSK